jgi:hypothetical protein
VVLISVLGCALALSSASAADGDPPAVARLIQMNRRALEAYDKQDWRSAKSHLWQAIAEGKKAGIETHPIVARTYLHLGAVYLTGLDDRESALQFFGRALRIDPTIRVASAMETTEIAGAFMEAQTAATRTRPAAEPRRADSPASKSAGVETRREDDAPAPALASGVALDCPNADEVVRDQVATIRCAVATGLKVGSVVLFFRVPGQGAFTAVDMKMTAKGWYVGQISRDVTGGKSVQFYVEGRDQNGKAIVANGRSGSPNLMLVREAGEAETAAATATAAVAATPPADATADREENPLDAAPGAVVHRANREPSRSPNDARKWWLGLGVGSGFGYAKGDGLEIRKDLQSQFGSGVGWAGLGQLSPEIGLHLSPDLAVALQGRNQWIPQSGAGSRGYATSANAALLRLLFFSRPGALRFHGGPILGYGTFRFVFTPDPSATGVKDTVKGGSFVAGAGGGLSYQLTHTLALMVESNVLLGYSAVSAVCDLNAGLQVSFY